MGEKTGLGDLELRSEVFAIQGRIRIFRLERSGRIVYN